MKTLLAIALACSCTALAPATALAQHEEHGAVSPDQIGSASVKFDTSCAPAVRDDFNRAIALLHSFWFPEAARAFQAVAQKDPSCAMAHWGRAMTAWGNPFGGLRSSASIERGRAIVAQAESTGSPTPRERALIDAVAILFSDTDPGTQRDRVLRYEAAMEKIASAYPDDVEVWIFYGLAVTQSASPFDKTYAKQLQAAAILEPLFARLPDHPGLAHYIIHAYDAPPLAERALPAARRYASLAPAVPHALHMPSHTFTRVGYWKESIETNRRSAEAARKSSGVGEELHALDYQAYAYLQIAQDKAARAVVDRALSVVAAAASASEQQRGAVSAGAGSFAAAAIPARYALERRDWEMAAALKVWPANTPYTEAMTHFARAIGAARSGRPEAAMADIERLGELAAALEAMKDEYWAEQVGIQRRIVHAWLMFARGQRSEAIAALREAADAEDRTDKSAISPGPLAPARELLGEMLLEAGDARAALDAFEATMKKEPNRFRGTYGAARAASLAGDRQKAVAYYTQLLEIAREADTERPELVEARTYVASHRSQQ